MLPLVPTATSEKSPSLWKEEEIVRISDYIGEPASLLNQRRQAFLRLKNTAWPTSLDESWRRNNPRLIGRNKFGLKDFSKEGTPFPVSNKSTSVESFIASRVALQNCQIKDSTFVAGHSESGLTAGSLNQGFRSQSASLLEKLSLDVPEDKDSPAVSLLHSAFSSGGSYCLVPDNWSSPWPIFISHQMSHSGKAFFPKNIIHVGRDSRATVILEQQDLSEEEAWLGVSTRIYLAEGARLDLIALNHSGVPVNFYDHLHVDLKKNSTLNLTWFDNTSGWTVMRREAFLSGKGAVAKLRGAYIGSDSSLYDLRTLQDHTAEATFSDLMFKAVNFGSAKSVYQGLIKVSPVAINANAYQLNRNLLMSSEARADSIPKLEILVDEVKCTHGASVGKPDASALFYLRSRGISQKDATRLIVEGFLDEAGDLISDHHLRAYWRDDVIKRFDSVFA